MKAYERDPSKRPAAVVLLTRGPLVLAITCKHRISDLQLIGGKAEDEDGDLAYTAIRELHEEAGIMALVGWMVPLIDYVAHTGRPVRAFVVHDLVTREWPETLGPTRAGWPGWVDPWALLTPLCTYREEAAVVLRAATATNDALALALAHVDWARI